MVAAAAAGRRARQLRDTGQRRPAGGLPLHRVPADPRRDDAGRRHRRGRRRHAPQLRRPRVRARGAPGGVPQPAGQRRVGHRGRHGHQHGPAQPGRGRLRGPPPDQAPGRRPRRPDALRARSRPADRRQDRRARRHPRGLRDRPGHLPHPGDGPRRERHPAPQGHRRHRAAVGRRPRAGEGEDRRARTRQEAAGHHGRRRLHRPAPGPATRHRGEERLQPRGDPRAALPADPARGHVRHQQRRPRRRPAPDDGPQGAARGLHRAPPRRRTSAQPAPQAEGAGAAAPRRRPARRDPRHRRGHRGDPLQRRHRGCARATDVGLRPDRDPGQLHPRDAVAPPHEVLPDRARGRAGDAAPHDRRADRDHRVGQAAPRDRLDRAGRGRQAVRHAAPDRAARVVGNADHDGRPARGERRPVLGAALLDRSAGADARAPTRCRPTVRAPSTTSSCPWCARRRAARWAP